MVGKAAPEQPVDVAEATGLPAAQGAGSYASKNWVRAGALSAGVLIRSMPSTTMEDNKQRMIRNMERMSEYKRKKKRR